MNIDQSEQSGQAVWGGMPEQDLDVLFFDLDHTLWDFERNSGEALAETLQALDLVGRHGLTVENFIARYHVINDRMWDEYRRGLIAKSELRSRRFEQALALFSIRDRGLAVRFADMYLAICPRKRHLFPGVESVLQTLSSRYPVWLLTNGFSEVQAIKVDNPAIKPYIRAVVTSEAAGAKKPAREIFHYAAAQAGVSPSRCAMVGDDLQNDVLAGLDAGFACGVWFDPAGKGRGRTLRTGAFRVEALAEIPVLFE